MPLYLAEQYQGWNSRQLIVFFKSYAHIVFARYGIKVKHWLTFNERNIFLHEPFTGAGIARGSDPQSLYQRTCGQCQSC
ncbi:MAG: 6-phospho-beta-glucosidase [Psychromonas sp.]|jgi:6-phospho-beta-glucosidase